jgi:hypothetical protein
MSASDKATSAGRDYVQAAGGRAGARNGTRWFDPFDPSGRGRPMKEWVVVPPAHRQRWDDLADAAPAFVRDA